MTTTRHKSPVEHTVKLHKRKMKTSVTVVRQHRRGHGTKAEQHTKTGMSAIKQKIVIPSDWHKTGAYGPGEQYRKWNDESDHSYGANVVAIITENDSMIHTGSMNEFEVHSFLDTDGTGDDLDVEEYHGGAQDKSAAREIAVKIMKNMK